MKNIVSAILVALATILITFFFNLIFLYFSDNAAQIDFGGNLDIDGTDYTPMTINNYSDNPLNNLLVQLPTNINSQSIISSTPITFSKVEDTKSSQHMSIFRFSNIQSKTITRILIPLDKMGANKFYVVNKKDLNVKVIDGIHTSSGFYISFKEQIIPLLISLLIMGLFTYYFINDASKTRLKIQTWATKFEKNEVKFKREQTEIRNLIAKARILNAARLSDYAKELNFWRDTIRKILYLNSESKIVADELFSTVTDMLKTYNTRSLNATNDIKLIDAMSKVLNFREE